MTTKELIAILKELPEDATMWMQAEHFKHSLKDILYDEDKNRVVMTPIKWHELKLPDLESE